MTRCSRRSAAALAFLAFALSVLALPLSAARTIYDGDCYYCSYTGITGISEECRVAPNNQWGEGTTCTEATFGALPTACWTTGGSCYRITVTPGGGGSTGGSGGGTCQGGSGSFCPAECFSCGGGGAPRI